MNHPRPSVDEIDAEIKRNNPCPSFEEFFGRQDREDAIKMAKWASHFTHKMRFDEAERLYLNALDIIEQIEGPEHIHVAWCLRGLATLYISQGSKEKAEPLYLRDSEIVEKVMGPEHPELATCLHWIAVQYLEEGKHEPAEPLLRRAITIYEKALGPTAHETIESLMDYAHVLDKIGRNEEADAIWHFVNAEWERNMNQEQLERRARQWDDDDSDMEDPFAGE